MRKMEGMRCFGTELYQQVPHPSSLTYGTRLKLCANPISVG